jgi:GT2 family glycosyltransferase
VAELGPAVASGARCGKVMLDCQWEGDSQPAASIITVNTNEIHRLKVLLPSVFATRGRFEVIISDNGSTDGCLDSFSEQFPGARIVYNGSNIGFAAANNRAAQIARNNVFVFVNPDTRVHPDWLRHLLQPFEDPGVGLTTSKMLLMSDPETINSCGTTMHISGLTLCRGMGRPMESHAEGDEVAAIQGAAFAIRRELFELLGGFDEDFFIYVEESDLSLRARLNGWKCRYVPQSIVWHDYNLRFGPNKVLYQERNRYVMLLKTLKWPTLIALLPVYVLAEIVTWGFVLLKDRSHWKNKLRAYHSIMVNWPAIMRKRRATQRLRRVTDREVLRSMDFRLDFGQAADGWLPYLAGAVFTPAFLVLRIAVRGLVRW